MNLEALALPESPEPNPGMDTLDPRWGDISGLVQEMKFQEAAAASEALLAEGIYDIRLMGYLCFGAFGEGGLVALGKSFDALSTVLTDGWTRVGPPEPKRDKTTASSLTWLFKQLHRALQWEEENHSAKWNTWSKMLPEELEQVLSAGLLLEQALGVALADRAPPVIELFAKVRDWLREFRNVVAKPEEPAPEAAPEAEAAPASETADRRPAEGSEAVEGSLALRALIRKMEAFEKLVREEKLAQARIVADDVTEVLGAFDPTVYFPKLFAGFLRLMATHVNDMLPFEDERDSPAWRARVALYRADLDAFLEL